MITKVIIIFGLVTLQNVFLFSSVYSAEKYIEVDKIIAIVEAQTITNSELDKKKRVLVKHYLNKKMLCPLIKKLQNYP